MNDREIEHKYLAKAESLEQGIKDMRTALAHYTEHMPGDPANSVPFAEGLSKDYYYYPADRAPGVDFVRLRRNFNPSVQHTLTTKRTDKGDSIDRQEINVSLARDEFRPTRRMLQSLLGLEALKFVQQYALWRPDLKHPDCVLSVYTIDISNLVFIEVEALELETVEYWSRVIEHITKRQLKRSLWDLFGQEYDPGLSGDQPQAGG